MIMVSATDMSMSCSSSSSWGSLTMMSRWPMSGPAMNPSTVTLLKTIRGLICLSLSSEIGGYCEVAHGSQQDTPAGHIQHGAGHPAGLVGSQVQDRPGDIVRDTEPANGMGSAADCLR
jgi:hypothetical protein